MLESCGMDEHQIILASNSPRRQQLITLGGWKFRVWPANIDEGRFTGEAPDKYVFRVAEAKAGAVTKAVTALQEPGFPSNVLVLAADTTVADGDEILGKPDGPQDARRMLRQLRGKTHQVYTALVLISLIDGKLSKDLCVTQVPMRNYFNEEIDAYVDSSDPLDKAGAYAIQNPDFHPVDTLMGCYASVMGLPLCHLVRTLRQFDVFPQTDVPKACQAALSYDCPVFAAILRGEQVG